MRVSKKRQVLTTGAVDINRNVIPPDAIDWSRFDANPLLRYDREHEGHRGVAVGKVIERERIGDAFVGRLAFMERFEDADIAFEKYEQGILRYVSIGGFALGNENEDGIFVADTYLAMEVSLVAQPANIECRPIEDRDVASEADREIVEGMRKDGCEVRYLTMGFSETEYKRIEASLEESDPEPNNDPEPRPVNAGVDTQKHGRRLPNGMTWHEQQILNQTKPINMEKTFRELNCDADFQKRLHQLGAAFRTGATAADKTTENTETVRMLTCSMLNDERMVTLASATNFTDGVTHERKNGLRVLVECAAGGAAANTLAAADLGVIKWLSLFYEKLLPDNTFMRSVRFVPMSDREGAIYVESGVNPATYVGSVTPVNAPRYFYEDIKRTIARQVFSIQPMTFQNAELAILAYDKQSWGWTIAMDSLMAKVATFILQVVANTTGVSKIFTSGDSVSSQGLFPIEAPNSKVNIKKLVPTDLINLMGAFLTQNFDMNNRRVEVVLPSQIYTMAAANQIFQSILTRNLSGATGSGFEWNGMKIGPRNPVARYNTTSGKPELDPAMYADYSVDADGDAAAISPAVTVANTVGAGVAFVENEIIAGIGTIDVIVMPDPTNYGYTYSGWMSAGATVARDGGKGVALVVPALAE